MTRRAPPGTLAPGDDNLEHRPRLWQQTARRLPLAGQGRERWMEGRCGSDRLRKHDAEGGGRLTLSGWRMTRRLAWLAIVITGEFALRARSVNEISGWYHTGSRKASLKSEPLKA